MSEITRPSNLGEWATCAKKMRHLAANPRAGRGGPHIAAWVGDAVHYKLSGDHAFPLDEPPPMSLYDRITPNQKTAYVQVDRIITEFYRLMGRNGLEPKAWECGVEDADGHSGTLDVILEKDTTRHRILGDVKTGRRVPSGVWLQLGAYWSMAQHAFINEPINLGPFRQNTRLHSIPEVAVIHVPRTKLGEDQPGTIEFRDGRKCADEAKLWYRAIGNLLEDDAEVDEYPASPGLACATCPMNVTECAVRIYQPKE